MVNRRELLIAGTGTAIAWPRATRAQQKAMPVIGHLGGTTPGTNASFVAAFRRGLNETGDVEGQNVAIDIAGRRATMIGAPPWPPTLSAAKST